MESISFSSFSHFNSYSHFLSPSPCSPPGSSYGRLTVLLQGGNFSHLLEKTITGSLLSCTFLMTVSSCSYGQCKIKMQKNFWAINTKFIFYKLTSTAPYSSSLLSKRFQELQTKVSCYHNNQNIVNSAFLKNKTEIYVAIYINKI